MLGRRHDRQPLQPVGESRAFGGAAGTPGERQARLQGRTRAQLREPNYRGYDAYQRAIFPFVDHLLPQSRAELANLKKTHGIEKPFTLVHNGAETAVFDQRRPTRLSGNTG